MNTDLIDFLFLTKIIEKKRDVKINGLVIERDLLLDDKKSEVVKSILIKLRRLSIIGH